MQYAFYVYIFKTKFSNWKKFNLFVFDFTEHFLHLRIWIKPFQAFT